MLVQYFDEQFDDRPDLLEHVVPTYPVGAKRMLRDDGTWAGALTRPNVQLVTTPIREITETGVVTTDGTAHDVDVIIWGTGFTASEFLMPMQVVGRDGLDLHESWGDDARAYLGVAIPHFPNFFCLYGPNTNIVVNGSIIYFSECGTRLIMGLPRSCCSRRDGRALEVKADVHDEFNVLVDEQNRNMAWGWSDVNSWYKNKQGRITQNWPFTLLEYWERTREPDPGRVRHLLTGRGGRASPAPTRPDDAPAGGRRGGRRAPARFRCSGAPAGSDPGWRPGRCRGRRRDPGWRCAAGRGSGWRSRRGAASRPR